MAEPAAGAASAADPAPDRLDRALIAIQIVTTLGALLSILDTTIVNVALETFSREFHSPLSNVQWIATSYLLALGTVVPLAGWTAERFGAKRVWMVSVALFVLGSIACGFAWDLPSLIGFRVLQGVGGGLMIPVGQTILAQAAGPARMARAMALSWIVTLMGPVLGPVIGGAIVDGLTWRWLFFVNVPVGVVALVAATKLLPDTRSDARHRLDVRGLALLSPGLVLLLYGISEFGASAGRWTTAVVASLAAGFALTGGFVVHALRLKERALIELALFRDRSFGGAAINNLLIIAAIFGGMVLLPLYYQVVRGESATRAGLLMAAQPIGAALMTVFSARIADRSGAGRVVPFGILIAAGATIGLAYVGPHTSYWQLNVILFVRGFGFGATIMPAMAVAFASLPREAIPRATVAINIVQRLGGSLGIALLAVVLERRIDALIPGAHGISTYVQGIPAAQRAAVEGPLAHAFGQAFWVAVGIAALAFVPALFLPRHPVKKAAG